MSQNVQLTSTCIVYDVMRLWPETIRVFLCHRMACVGCAMARYCTLEEAIEAYKLDDGAFFHELEQLTQPTSTHKGDSK